MRYFLPRHGRTHCPGGSDPIPCLSVPCFRMMQDAALGGQSIPDGIETIIKFNIWETSDANIMDHGTITPGSPPYILSVRSFTGGVYAISINVDFGPSLPITTNVGLAIEEGALDFASPAIIYPGGYLAGDNSSGSYSMTHIRGYPPIWFDAGISTASSAPSIPTWRFNVTQSSGTSKNILWAMAEIYRLADLSVSPDSIGS